MHLHAGSGHDVISPLPYGRMTYTGSKGRAPAPLSPLRGAPSVFVPTERGYYITSGNPVNIPSTYASGRLCFFIVQTIDDRKPLVYDDDAMKESQ